MVLAGIKRSTGLAQVDLSSPPSSSPLAVDRALTLFLPTRTPLPLDPPPTVHTSRRTGLHSPRSRTATCERSRRAVRLFLSLGRPPAPTASPVSPPSLTETTCRSRARRVGHGLLGVRPALSLARPRSRARLTLLEDLTASSWAARRRSSGIGRSCCAERVERESEGARERGAGDVERDLVVLLQSVHLEAVLCSRQLRRKREERRRVGG